MKENVSLAPLTTLGVGGAARFFVEVQSEKDIAGAIEYAKGQNVPLVVLGNGSNVLVPDEGVAGVVMKMNVDNISFEKGDGTTLLIAGAGTQWGKIVDVASERGLFGIENLAGIPGTIGGAVVQNIGAYGAELSDTFAYADVIDVTTGERKRVNKTEADFSYRTSLFKKRRELIVVRVALYLSEAGVPNLNYPDIVRMLSAGEKLSTPEEVASAIRAIRAKKFPCNAGEGTAGSFFKNPVIPRELADSLAQRFVGLPVFPQEGKGAKISLAWLLDHALSLKGFSQGNVRLYEKQPLVIVARAGATAKEIDNFANVIAERVYKEIGISIEREVEMFGTITGL